MPLVPILRHVVFTMVSRKSNPNITTSRRYPIGVEFIHDGQASIRAHARVWASCCKTVELVTDGDEQAEALAPEGDGYFSGFVPHVSAGSLYRYRLDEKDAFPDPASRYQPSGPHGPSMVIDPSAYQWGDADWPGVSVDRQVIYELHVGTFTRAGTFLAAIERLPDLVDTGITLLEVMPVADFSGLFGWGYDGVNFFAPTRLYGTPDDFRAFIDAAHRLKLGVLLDVVYNHFGPDGNYLANFSSRYLSDQRGEWGDAPNFDGDDSEPVREFYRMNARYWMEEFHLDGLRLDATQQIVDRSPTHIIAEIGDAVRNAAPRRPRIIVGENEPQHTRLVRPRAANGYGLDALWNDDFHHVSRVAATGRTEAYFSGYRGVAQEFVSAAKYGYLYQGQWYAWQHHGRGTPAFDLSPTQFVTFIENHDQVANSAAGARLHHETHPGRYRALTTLLLLLPQTPMLFQGQEFGASAPFLYFADHGAELAKAVREGRAQFMSQFPSIAAKPGDRRLDDPANTLTFLRSKLDWSERRRHVGAVALHRDLLRLRREDAVISRPRARGVDGAVLSERAFVLRFFGGDHGDRLLVVNLAARLHADPAAEPLLAPPIDSRWQITFSSEAPEYGGWGTPALDTPRGGWWIPAESATLMAPTNAPTPTR